jgi:hypothetical protein
MKDDNTVYAYLSGLPLLRLQGIHSSVFPRKPFDPSAYTGTAKTLGYGGSSGFDPNIGVQANELSDEQPDYSQSGLINF